MLQIDHSSKTVQPHKKYTLYLLFRTKMQEVLCSSSFNSIIFPQAVLMMASEAVLSVAIFLAHTEMGSYLFERNSLNPLHGVHVKDINCIFTVHREVWCIVTWEGTMKYCVMCSQTWPKIDNSLQFNHIYLGKQNQYSTIQQQALENVL